MRRYPLLPAGIAAALGAATALPLANQERALLVCGVAAACVFLAQRDLSKAVRAATVAALVLGAASGAIHQRSAAHLMRAHTTRLSCVAIDDAAEEDQRFSYSCQTDLGAIAVSGSARVHPGDRLLLRGRLEPFDEPRNPGEPDQREIERERGLVARLSAAQVLQRLPPAPMTVKIAIAKAQSWAFAQLRSELPEPAASILAGEMWGERAALAPNLRAEFQETGTVHILVTAGLHMGAMALIVLGALKACRAPRFTSCIATAVLLWGYALFSGMHVPAMRAATMISFGLAAYAAGAKPLTWNGFGAALLTIAICDPQALGSASFALSFSCVGAILLTADPIEELLRAHIALPARAREALSLSLATQLGTWPVTASVFMILAPYAVLANVLVVPFVAATMVLGGAQLALAPIPALSQAAANLNAWLLTWIVGCVERIAGLPASSLPMSPAPVWCICAYDAALLPAVWCWKRGARTAALAFLVVGIALVATPPLVPDERLRVTVLDVGQADSIFVRTPLGHTILVDAGGRLERGAGSESTAEQIGERTVVPFLRRAGTRSIDAIVLSHPHGDHAGGVAPVLRSFHDTAFADSGQRYGGYAYNDALQTAHGERVPIVYPRAGMVWQTDDGLRLKFLGPSLPLIAGSRNDINNNSIAFILQYKRFRMLFTGDAGAEAEQRFLREGVDLHADVLKVGHHGSAYSSTPEFIAAVRPHYAIISVGRHNMFGHPAPSTLETLQRYGARIYRTDENGAVTIVTDGSNEYLSTMLPN